MKESMTLALFEPQKRSSLFRDASGTSEYIAVPESLRYLLSLSLYKRGCGNQYVYHCIMEASDTIVNVQGYFPHISIV